MRYLIILQEQTHDDPGNTLDCCHEIYIATYNLLKLCTVKSLNHKIFRIKVWKCCKTATLHNLDSAFEFYKL